MCRANQTEMFRFETANFIVRATIQEDYDLDLSWDDDGEVRAKLESGEYQSFGTILTVTTGSGLELASDSLWGSIYAKPADFFTEHRGLAAKSRADGCNYGSYFPDMVREAISEARKALANMPKLRVA